MGLIVTIIFLCLWSGIGCVVFCSEADNGFQFIKHLDTEPVKCTKLFAFFIACGPCTWALFLIMTGFAFYTKVIVPLSKRTISKFDKKRATKGEH